MLFAACCETGIFSRYIDFIYTSIYYYLLFCESPVLRNAGDFFVRFFWGYKKHYLQLSYIFIIRNQKTLTVLEVS